MNIVELCLSKGFGGLELYCANACREIATWPEHKVFPVVRTGSFLQQRLQEDGLSVTCLERSSHHLPFIAAVRLARHIDKNRIDVIHMHWAKDLLLAVLAKRLAKRRVRVVYTRQMELTRSKHDAYHRWVYAGVDRFLCITQVLVEQARRWLPIDPQRVELLYYGVRAPSSAVTNCDEQYVKHGIRQEAFKVGLFGRIEHYKGQHLLLEAVKLLVDKGLDVQAAIIGRVYEQDYMQGLVDYVKSQGLERHYVRIDFINNPQQLMACFDVVALTTYKETFGLVLIEAMRAGTAVVGSKAGGVPEIIEQGKSGMLFEPGSAASLAAQLEQLIQDPALRQQIARTGKAFADTHFAYEQHYTRLKELLTA